MFSSPLDPTLPYGGKIPVSANKTEILTVIVHVYLLKYNVCELLSRHVSVAINSLDSLKAEREKVL